ncbi:hypothetical protein JDV02_009848 [Purpureocillium takamizusanense]|uniref:Uncharacterized protein n=1 Tax=Purpureocillium takamizusanense TaxID=2060973 RepID=A0A9Q8QQL7_9HYPO|nr:uncharacterized protein JDV02_009848 [Purpureocillium takamizusanense]UNI24070.1 hypothetical protein JDV02_009848 [Purpureocillium takamizusanense]
MSASKNSDAMTAAQGEFRSKYERGTKVGKDHLPEFHAETHLPGTAPASRTFQPRPVNETVPSGGGASVPTAASDTPPGATSAGVHRGLGHPGQGMTSQELHGGKRSRDGAGLEGVGINSTDPAHERGFDRDYETGYRGKAREDYPGAEDRLPTSAEEVASERL